MVWRPQLAPLINGFILVVLAGGLTVTLCLTSILALTRDSGSSAPRPIADKPSPKSDEGQLKPLYVPQQPLYSACQLIVGPASARGVSFRLQVWRPEQPAAVLWLRSHCLWICLLQL